MHHYTAHVVTKYYSRPDALVALFVLLLDNLTDIHPERFEPYSNTALETFRDLKRTHAPHISGASKCYRCGRSLLTPITHRGRNSLSNGDASRAIVPYAQVRVFPANHSTDASL